MNVLTLTLGGVALQVQIGGPVCIARSVDRKPLSYCCIVRDDAVAMIFGIGEIWEEEGKPRSYVLYPIVEGVLADHIDAERNRVSVHALARQPRQAHLAHRPEFGRDRG